MVNQFLTPQMFEVTVVIMDAKTGKILVDESLKIRGRVKLTDYFLEINQKLRKLFNWKG